jgi:four helix bundle protein
MENSIDKYNSFFRFEDLRIYHKSLDFVEFIQKTTSMFNEDYKESLAFPMLRAAQSISVNIAEGSARNKSQFVYYLKMAKSSLRECVVYTSIARKADLISDESEEESRRQLMELTKMIGALIASLQKAQAAAGMEEKHKDDIDFDD